MNIKEDLLKQISHISKIPENELSLETEIYNSGIISSLALLEIMTILEKRYNVWMKPEELIEDNFKDISKLIKFIEKKLVEHKNTK